MSGAIQAVKTEFLAGNYHTSGDSHCTLCRVSSLKALFRQVNLTHSTDDLPYCLNLTWLFKVSNST